MTPFTIILGLFLLYFFGFLAWVAFSQWLIAWTGDFAMAVAVGAAIATLFAVAVALARSSAQMWGFIIAASMILFWSFIVFEVSGQVRILAVAAAGALLVIGVAVALAEYWKTLRPPAPPPIKPPPTGRSVAKRTRS